MENYRFNLPLLPTPGKLTTVYAVDGGAARNAVLACMAGQLAEQAGAGLPVLMIDWDTEAPALHAQFGGDDGAAHSAPRPGLLEYFAACRAQLALQQPAARAQEKGRQAKRPAAGEGAEDVALEDGAEAAELARARQVVEAVDWQPFVERVDDSRPLYLMRAGCFDDSYGERAAGADWEGLFHASPSLYRCVAEHLGRHFGHVLVASRGGRSAEVSVCTSLLADRLVLLFSPNRCSLDGACAVVRRAIAYRSSEAAAQRPLLVYPLPIELDGADQARRLRWRHGEGEQGGYQCAFEQLMRDSYALPELSLDSYFDHVQLQQLNAMAAGEGARLPRTADRLSLAQGLASLLDWAADGSFPWQARAELAVRRRIERSRHADPEGVSPAVQAHLAAALFELGRLQRQQGRHGQALASAREGASMQAALWGAGHADTRPGRLELGAQLRCCGQADAALGLYRELFDECLKAFGEHHPDTLAARAGLAAALADCGRFDSALNHAAQVTTGWRERCGLQHRNTLAAQAAHADLLAQAGDPGRARMLLEQVCEGRERLLGSEHADTLASSARLALLLRQVGQMEQSRALQEQVLASRQRLLGTDHADSIEAGLALAQTVAEQCDLQRVGELCGPLAAACQRRYGKAHPLSRSAALQMAGALAREAGLAQSVAPARPWRPLAPAGLPHESGFACCAFGDGVTAGRGHADPSEIERCVLRLEQMEDCAAVEARELADRLRQPVLTANVAPLVRARGVRAIVDVYFHQGDTDALVAFMQEQRPLPAR